MNGFRMRRCGPGDGPRLALLGSATFLQSYAEVLQMEDILTHTARHHSAEAYERLLAEPGTYIDTLELETTGTAIGYIVCTPPDLPPETVEAGDLELRRIYLLHRFHGAGMGQVLMQRAIANGTTGGHRRLTLGVYGENRTALRFYERSGFRIIGERWFTVGRETHHDHVLALDLPSSTAAS